jgi:hypothetical protein
MLRWAIVGSAVQQGKAQTMKTVSIALVSASVLALTACGGGGKGNNSSSANTSSATEQVNSVSPLPPAGEAGNSAGVNTTGPVETNTLGNTNAGGNTAATTNSTAANSTTK